MQKPIDKLDFWKQRIDKAQKKHYSVYISNDSLWNNINLSHEKIIKELIKPNEKVLDAGCGYGRSSIFFDNYLGIDFSPDFIELAKKEHPDKEFIVGNLKELPFKDKEFDWAFCISIKKMVEDNLGKDEWLKMEKELKRVAKKVLILEYEDYEGYEIL